MSAKPNYFKLGVFILLGVSLLVAGIILFGSGVFAGDKNYFESYFTDSVQGLSVGAPVQSSGVKIGQVEKISFVRHRYEFPRDAVGYSEYDRWVRVVCSVVADNMPEAMQATQGERLQKMIDKGLRLKLSNNILTGQAMVEAEYVNPERFKVPAFPWQPEYFYVPSAPSAFTTLKESIDRILFKLESIETQKIADNLNAVLVSVKKMADQTDIQGVAQQAETFFANANRTLTDAQVAELSDQARHLFAEARQTNLELKKLLENPTPDKDLANLALLVDQMETTITRIDQLVRVQSPHLIQMLGNFKQISDHLNILIENLKENPSDLIFSQPPKQKGGES